MDTSLRITVNNSDNNNNSHHRVNVRGGRGWNNNYNNNRGGRGWHRGGRDNNNNHNNNNYNRNSQRGGGEGSGTEHKKKSSGGMVPRKDPLSDLPADVLNIRVIVTRLGDYSQMSEEDMAELNNTIKGFAGMFFAKGDLYNYPVEISSLFVSFLSSLSIQVPIMVSLIAVVVGLELANPVEGRASFGECVVTATADKFVSSLKERSLPTCKLLLRSLCCYCLTGCISGQTLSEVLRLLLSKANQGDMQIVWLLATAVPWIVLADPSLGLSEVSVEIEKCLSQLLLSWESPFLFDVGVRAVLLRPPPLDAEDGSDDLTATPDSFSELLKTSIELLRSSSSMSLLSTPPACMVLPWTSFSAEDLPNNNIDTNDKKYVSLDLGELSSLLSDSNNNKTTTDESICCPLVTLFDSDSSPEAAKCLGSLTALDRVLTREAVLDLVNFFDPVVNEDGTKLGSIDLMANHLLAVMKLFPAETHLEYLLVETLMQRVLQAPSSSNNNNNNASIYKLLLTLCKKNSVFPPVLALAVNIAFQLVPDMTALVWRQFAKWFSFHLVNTQLVWPYWQFWMEEYKEAEQQQQHVIRMFLQIIVDKCHRSSIADKIKAAFPAEVVSLSKLLLSSLAGKVHPVVFADEESLIDLKKLVESKPDPDDVDEWIRSNHSSGEALFKVLLLLGSGRDALSGLLGLVDVYSEVLRNNCDSDSLEVVLLLFEVYGTVDMGDFDFLLDELLRRGLVSVVVACRWAVSELPTRLMSDYWMFSVTETIVDRTIDFVRAAVAHRMPLGGQLVMDQSMDLVSSESTSIRKASAVTEGNQAAYNNNKDLEEVDYDEDDEEDGNRRRVRSRREDTTNEGDEMKTDNNNNEEEDDPVLVATEVVKNAIRNSRAVFADLVTTTTRLIEAEDSDEFCILLCKSLLKRILITFARAELSLSQTHGQTIVLSDRSLLEDAATTTKVVTDISSKVYATSV